MPHVDFIDELVILCITAVGVILLFRKINLPPIIGLIASGVLLGPMGLGMMGQDTLINGLAELGITLLLFTIGLEFSLDDLIERRKLVIVGGTLQVVVCTAIIAGGAFGLSVLTGYGLTLESVIVIGMAFSLSSTAFCMKLLNDKGELFTQHGKAVVGLLVFQDIIIVPMMIVVSLLAPGSNVTFFAVLLRIGILVGIVAGLALLMRVLMPKLVKYVVRTDSAEVLVLGALGLCFGAAFITQSLGMSLALGAFLAGATIAETEESKYIERVMAPFRDAFTSVFFMSVGMLLHINWNWLHVNLLAALGVIVANAVVVALLLRALGTPKRTVIISGVILAEIGEFSFLVATTGRIQGILSDEVYQNVLVCIITTLVVTPVLVNKAPKIADYFSRPAAPLSQT
ncbi:MAG: hypothetical protein AMXMBFR68_05790 [Ignavibacteria bacterium]